MTGPVRHGPALVPTHRLLLVIGLLLAGANLPAAGQGRAAVTGEGVLREVHQRYYGKRFTHVTFVQTTDHGAGHVETWYEALAPGGRVRVDIAPLESRNGFIYRADSQYVFRAGQITRASGGQRWLSMLVLLDLYALPIDRVLSRAADLGLRLDQGHETTWRGRAVSVAGALSGDTLSPQVWYDREHLYPVRLIQRAGPEGPRYDWHLDRHVFTDGGWIEGEIRIHSEGRLLVTETYDSIVPRSGLSESLFVPTPYRPPAWVSEPPDTAGPDPDLTVERLLTAVGGRAAWASLSNTVNTSRQYRLEEPTVVEAVITMEFARPRFRIETTGPDLHLIRVIDGPRSWRLTRQRVIEDVPPELLRSELRWYAGHVYRTLHRLAVRDAALRVALDAQGRLEVYEGEVRIAWFALDVRGEPYAFGAHDDDTGTITGPWLVSRDGIRHPAWVARPDGSWRAMLTALTVNARLDDATFARPGSSDSHSSLRAPTTSPPPEPE